ncbi:MAG: DNA primase [Ruminococcaceae bacterium]|nr:DNA primase [Oscillospiraceae bacterium]
MMIPREIIDEIVYRNDIEQVISSYVTLKRAGSNLNGLCPFHSEKTPSFTVFPATKSFYCFGCGAGGDVITFIMRSENLDYADALRFLAQRAGITIPEDESQGGERTVSRKRIYEMNLAAARFFRDCLFDPKYGAEAMRYLTEERRLSMTTIKRFGIGFSPNNAWMLTNHMHSLGYTDEELVTGFLCGKSRNSGKTYDYFRNRVIFPIIDTTGNIVAFGGRVMDDSKPKYLNTSDTPAFKKSRHLFALNFAKNHAEEQMILCEGYMDVIALHAAGFENAVATLGTAITADQARIFAKYTKKVVITYDSDNAGQTAADKAMRLLGEAGVDVRVLKLEGAKDPDEFIKKYGTAAFKNVINESKSGFDFKMDKVISKYKISLAEEKIKAADEICRIIAAYYSGVEREIYILSASKQLGLSREVLLSDVERIRKKMRYEAAQKQSREAMMSAKNLDNRVNRDAAKHIRANAAEEALIGMMLIFDDLRAVVASGDAGVSAEDFSTDFGRRVFEVICALEVSEYGFSKAMLGQYFGLDEMGKLEQIEQDRRKYSRNGREVLDEYVRNLKEEKLLDANKDDISFILNAKRGRLQKEKEKNNQ